MTIDYLARFTEWGKLLKHSDATLATITALDADRDEIENVFETNNQTHIIEGIATEFGATKQGLVNFRRQFATWAERIWLDRATVLDELPLAEETIDSAMQEILRDMIARGVTINRSVVAVGTIQEQLKFHGAGVPRQGVARVVKLLDGYTDPSADAVSQPQYNGLDSELCVPSETMYLTCVSDSQADGRNEGEEEFEWIGKIPDQELGFLGEASGSGPTIPTLNAGSIISNRNFEDFSGNSPTGWTIEAGKVAISPDTDTGLDGDTTDANIFMNDREERIFRGDKNLEFRGDGVQQTIAIYWLFAAGDLQPRRRYGAAFAYLISSKASAGDLTFRCEGTGYAALPSEQVVIEAQHLETTWQIRDFTFVTPEIIPADFRLVLRWDNTPRAETGLASSESSDTEDKGQISMFLDSVAFDALEYHGGLAAYVIAGRTRFVRGDRFLWPVTNTEGVFQRGARRQFGVQFNSALSPVIADSLAT